MPVSKRDKKVSLTKTGKKGMQLKQRVIEDIRKYLANYDNLYVLTIHNMRNALLKEVREQWTGSRFFFAKKRIMARALGMTEAEEVEKNIHKLALHLSRLRECGLLFTNEPQDVVVEWFGDFSRMDYAKAGFIATETVVLPEGPLPDFSHAIEPHLRKLGLPTKLEKGVIVLRQPHTVCKAGDRLTPEQGSILKLLGKEMAEFKIYLICAWHKDGSFEKFKIPKELRSTLTSTEPQKSGKAKSQDNNVSSGKIKKSRLIATGEDSVPESESTNNDIPILSSVEELSKLEVKEDNEVIDKNEASIQQNKSSKKRKNTPKKDSSHDITEDSKSSETPMEVESSPVSTIKNSPKFDKENPRRSMRTPKPIKRTPEQMKVSVKKLTESVKRQEKMTPKKSKGTPKQESKKLDRRSRKASERD